MCRILMTVLTTTQPTFYTQLTLSYSQPRYTLVVMGDDGPNAAVMLMRMSPHGVMIFMTGHLAAPPVITTITPPAANCPLHWRVMVVMVVMAIT